MSVDPFDPNTISYVRLFPWTRLFRAVGSAFDSKKLLLATLGMVLLGLGWGGLDRVFPKSSQITPVVRSWGAAESWPGIGPYDTLGRAIFRAAEPATFLMQPFVAIFSTTNDASAFLHALLAAAWGAVVWGLVGGAIARITLVQNALGESLGVGSAARFALRKWSPLIGAPLSPLVAVSLFAAFCATIGLLYRIPGVGPVVGGLLLFLPLLAGIVMTIILLGLALGWPLMHATIAAEGEDGFDALSRAYAYVNGRPGRYLAYLTLSWGLGTIGVLLVEWLARMIVHLARWGLSFGAPAGALAASFGPGGSSTSTVHGPWLGFVGLVTHAWVYSYFWTATALIYLLLRHDVDGTAWNDLDRPEHADDTFAPEPETQPTPAKDTAPVDPLAG